MVGKRASYTKSVDYRLHIKIGKRQEAKGEIDNQFLITGFSIKDYHLPWQKPQVNLTPERVAQSMFGLLVEIGTPAIAPKPRGKSPGWEKDKKRQKRKRYPVVKKRKSSEKKGKNNST